MVGYKLQVLLDEVELRVIQRAAHGKKE